MHALRTTRSIAGALGLILAAATSLAPRALAQLAAVSEQSADQSWAALQNDTYDQRDHFLAGANRLSAKLDDQIRALKAKRAGMTKDVDDWDMAMKDVDESRSLLTGRITEVKQSTTPYDWTAARDNVGDAWTKAEAAVDKMHTTVTS
jgi:hypothetical protein